MAEKPPRLRDFVRDKSDGEYVYVRGHLRRRRGGGGANGFEAFLWVVGMLTLIFVFLVVPLVKSIIANFFLILSAWAYWAYLGILLVISVSMVRWVYRDYRYRSRRWLPWYLLALVSLALVFLLGFWFLTWVWQTTTGDYYAYGCLGTILVIVGAARLYQRRRHKGELANEAKQRHHAKRTVDEVLGIDRSGLVGVLFYSAMPAITLFGFMFQDMFKPGLVLYWGLSACALFLVVRNTRVSPTKRSVGRDWVWLIVWVLAVAMLPFLARFLYDSIGYEGILVQIPISVPFWYIIILRRARIQAMSGARHEAEEEEQRKLDEQLGQLKAQYAIDVFEFERYHWDLPVYGFGEEGIKTSEFAEIIGEDSKIARRILESWRALGRARMMPSGREYKWWRTEA